MADEKTVLIGRCGPTVMLPKQGGQIVPLRRSVPLRVDVAGGGPVGLAFACTIKSLLGDQVSVRVHDRRWMSQGDRVVWRGEKEGNNRREQVVTLQSNVWAALPLAVQQRLFTPGRFSEMWPLGPDSPASKGRPRNIKIRWIEDCLLDMAQDVYGIEVVPGAYTPPTSFDGLHVLAIADGARSATRDAFSAQFGTPSRELFSVDGSPLDERVLGIRVTAKSPDEHTVPLTVAQNRFLFNSLGGGFINMRLTAEEASEIVALGESGPISCIGKFGCTMRPSSNGRFVCDRHRAVFKPSVDKLSYLWPRILDGLRFFGVGVADVVGINSFTLGMQQMSKFTAQLSPNTFGFLLGDAANSLHFWPGRGLNTGLKSALSLAVNLQKRWRGKSFRAADFAQHEGIMQQLQYREKSRAWTTMLMPDSEGTPRGIEDRIREGLQGPYDRAALVKTLFERVLDIKKRMGDRMGSLATDEWYYGRVNALDTRTLKVMVESGAWITREIGGEEVEVPSAVPAAAPAPVQRGLSLVS